MEHQGGNFITLPAWREPTCWSKFLDHVRETSGIKPPRRTIGKEIMLPELEEHGIVDVPNFYDSMPFIEFATAEQRVEFELKYG